MNSIIISIDGNIGSGKSTLFNKLETHYNDDNDIYFVPEPIDDWKKIVDSNNTPILSNLYQDTKKYAFRFQMMAYISRLSLLRKAIKNKYKIIITERCVQTDKNVFAKMLYDEGNIEYDEYQIYNNWFNEFLDEIDVAGIIYVKADPDICNNRVKIRAREGETIPIEYLKKCHDYHEEWLCKENNKLVINANVDIYNDKDIQNQWVNTIDKWIYNIKQKKNDVRKSDIFEYEYILQFDGACRGNPSDLLGLGCVLYKHDTLLDKKCVKQIVSGGTNNISEYMSLLVGLELCMKDNIKEILVQGDSELIIKQINGIYKVTSNKLLPYYNKVLEYKNKFKNIKFEHIKRNLNKIADSLANEALDNN